MNRLHPPRVRPILTVGVTGHRRLAPEAVEPLRRSIEVILQELAKDARAVAAAHPDVFETTEPQLNLLSGLAAGADQIAAATALELGWRLDAVLPFEAEEYARDFSGEESRRFADLLGQAHHAWPLPSSRSQGDHAYALAGQVTAAQSDLIIAVWDGDEARGPGGTADVVDYAIRRGVPVIWLPADGVSDASILWAGHDHLTPALLDRHGVPRRACNGPELREIVTRLLAPPAAPEQKTGLATYLAERQHLWRVRPEYPFLLILTGTRPVTKYRLRVKPYEEAARADWQAFRSTSAAAAPAAQPGLEDLQEAFGWSDALASHYSQTYRGGLVFNYTAAALSVVLALTGLLAPGAKIWLLLAELALIGSLIGNTARGTRANWHRRWLDYRYLAERLRPLRSLRLLGAATPGFNLNAAGVTKWTDWYAQALWRQLGPPAALSSQAELAALSEHVALHELDSQIAYNRANAARMHHLDHQLHRVGTALFYVTVLVGVISLVGYLFHIEVIQSWIKVMTVLSAALPTIGSALFGIRGQGDFAAAAGRSEATAERLQVLAHRLRSQPIDLATAARAAEDFAATMLDDLDEWHVSYRHRKLAIPA
ncbi:MAG TPA: hypothetical protein VM471_03665 [Phenylobacterium sp.]|nr:hypothetical protein [Phenylobacterium sp.]